MKQDLGPLGVVNMFTDDELRETLGHHFSALERSWYRGIDYMAVAGQGNGTGQITLPIAEQGYTWNIKVVSAQLSAAGNLSVYPADGINVAPIGVVAAVANGANFDAVLTFSGDQIVLKDGRNLTLFSSVNILNYRIMAKQVPTERQGKL